MERWPNFFIVGATKAGTTSLYEYLKDIPGIYMSPVKEPHYFDASSVPLNWIDLKPIRNKNEYLNLFTSVEDQKIIGEATPAYLADPDAAQLIHEVSPKAKILMSLRDPVERAYSNYLMYVRDGHWSHSFHDQLQNELENGINPIGRNIRLRLGMYFEDVKKYYDIFGKNQIKIIIFEDWIKDTKNSIQNILNYLGIEFQISEFEEERHNPYVVDRNPITRKIRTSKFLEKIVKRTISDETKQTLRNRYFVKKGDKPKIDKNDMEFLINYYESDVKKLELLIGRKLPWKNFQN